MSRLRPRFNFLSGLLAGLGALSALGSYRYVPPQMSQGGLESDWKAVGQYMRTAMRRFDDRAT